MASRSTLTALTVAAFGALATFAPDLLAGADDQGKEAHVVLQPDEFAYQPGPGSLQEGSEYAVLYGNPGSEELFAMRLKLPDGFHIPPHSHPRPEVVTVIAGTVLLGSGEDADPDAATRLETGSFFAFDPGMVHYVFTEGETVVQLNSTGPWDIEYVDPADDPRS